MSRIEKDAETMCIRVNGTCPSTESHKGWLKRNVLIKGPVMVSNAITPAMPAGMYVERDGFAPFKRKVYESAIAAYVTLVMIVHIPRCPLIRSNVAIAKNAKSGAFHHFSRFAAGRIKPMRGSEFGKTLKIL